MRIISCRDSVLRKLTCDQFSRTELVQKSVFRRCVYRAELVQKSVFKAVRLQNWIGSEECRKAVLDNNGVKRLNPLALTPDCLHELHKFNDLYTIQS
jgi:hypothetical protein